MKPARTKTFGFTISGLLKKRVDLLREARPLRERIIEIEGDIRAIDRVLGTLGQTGDFDAQMPRRRRVLFGRGKFTKGIFDELRIAEGPITIRNLCRGALVASGLDPNDEKILAVYMKRAHQVLTTAKRDGVVVVAKDAAGHAVWSVAA
jgi:hypothetical protein